MIKLPDANENFYGLYEILIAPISSKFLLTGIEFGILQSVVLTQINRRGEIRMEMVKILIRSSQKVQ